MDLDLSKRSKPCFKKNRMMSMGKVKNPFLKLCGIGLLTVICISVKAQKVNFTVNSKTGAIQSMNIDNDKQNMNWLIATDGSQYPWIKENYGWGLGYFTEVRRNQKNKLFLESSCQYKAGWERSYLSSWRYMYPCRKEYERRRFNRRVYFPK